MSSAQEAAIANLEAVLGRPVVRARLIWFGCACGSYLPAEVPKLGFAPHLRTCTCGAVYVVQNDPDFPVTLKEEWLKRADQFLARSNELASPTALLLSEAENQKTARIARLRADLKAAKAAFVLAEGVVLSFDVKHPIFGLVQRVALALHVWRNPKHPDHYADAHETIRFERCDDRFDGGWRVHVAYQNDLPSGGRSGYEFDVPASQFFVAWRHAEEPPR